MTLGRLIGTTFGFALLAIASPALPRASDADSVAGICVTAAQEASRRTGVPLNVLMALTLTETGRKMNGTLKPWPWALNQGGKSHWLPDQAGALALLAETLDSGKTNIDVGCFQLNYRWHGAAFPSLETMMDPQTNALYAARLVARLAGEEGDWLKAAAAYHSGTPDLAKIYMARFEPIYTALEGYMPQETPQPIMARANSFPLLQAGETRSSGSIVPIGKAARPLIGAP